MKNRGYTLLELLGVIVILALLTTLVFPSVLNAIKKSSNQTDQLSMDLISNAADIYIENNANEFIKFNGNKYIIEPSKLLDQGNLPSNVKISDIDSIEDKCIQVTYQDGFNYELKEKGTCEKTVQFDSICKLASDSTVTGVKVGAKYNCKVDPNKNAYTFYVLNAPDDNTIDLIMDRNICDDGSLATAKNTCTVAWNLTGPVSAGPVDAITHLYKATKTWTSVPALNYTYKDREYLRLESTNYGYTSFVSEEGLATITQLSGNDVVISTKEEPLRARIPIYNPITEMSYTNEVSYVNETNKFLYENLDYSSRYFPSLTDKEIKGIFGYWTLSSGVQRELNDEVYDAMSNDWEAYVVLSSGAVMIDLLGKGGYTDITNNNQNGVRPVITLPIKNSEMIPDEYQAVEYIGSTGTQYIDTGYLFSSDVIKIKTEFLITKWEHSKGIYGSQTSSDTNWAFNPYVNSELTENYWNFHVGSTGKIFSMYVTDNEWHINEVSSNTGSYEIKLDDSIVDTGSYSGTVVSGNTVSIFTINKIESRIVKAKIKSFNIYEQNQIKRYFIPCYRKSDGVIGMYDLVEDKFYTNSGTGTFEKGKDI